MGHPDGAAHGVLSLREAAEAARTGVALEGVCANGYSPSSSDEHIFQADSHTRDGTGSTWNLVSA